MDEIVITFFHLKQKGRPENHTDAFFTIASIVHLLNPNIPSNSLLITGSVRE